MLVQAVGPCTARRFPTVEVARSHNKRAIMLSANQEVSTVSRRTARRFSKRFAASRLPQRDNRTLPVPR
jgi:hypothetical protein